jgi:sulfur carrier protein ThiS
VKINIRFSRSNLIKTVYMKQGSAVEDLLKELHLKLDSIITMRQGIPIPVDDELLENDELTIIHVASGG